MSTTTSPGLLDGQVLQRLEQALALLGSESPAAPRMAEGGQISPEDRARLARLAAAPTFQGFDFGSGVPGIGAPDTGIGDPDSALGQGVLGALTALGMFAPGIGIVGMLGKAANVLGADTGFGIGPAAEAMGNMGTPAADPGIGFAPAPAADPGIGVADGMGVAGGDMGAPGQAGDPGMGWARGGRTPRMGALQRFGMK